MQNKDYINKLFSEEHKESEIIKAHIDIVAIQRNEKPLLKSGFNYIDDFLPDGLTNKMVFGGSRPAMGKCLAKGTEVIMFDGTCKKVEDIIEEDLLMGPDSTPRKVISLARGTEQMYWIRQNNAIDYRVNESHIISLKKSRREGKLSKGSVKNVSIVDYLDWSDKEKSDYKGYKVGWELPEKVLDIAPYMLGLFLGDGCSKTGIIHSIDSEILNYVKEYSKTLNLSYSEYKDKRTNVTSVRIIDKKRKNNSYLSALKKYNLLNNKHIPLDYLLGSREQRLSLLSGLLDTDGHIDNKTFEISQKSDTLAKDIKYLADSLGFKCTIRKKKSSIKSIDFEREYNRIFISGNVWEIPCKLKRKQKNIFKSRKIAANTGIRVEKDIVDNYFGFTIDGDHLFLLKDGTVTHNTFNCGELIDNLLNSEVNPEQEIEILRFNWEMISSSLLLRELKKGLKKSMKEIIKTPYTDAERPVVTEVVRKLDDPRILNVSRIIEGEDLRFLLRKFCETNPDKKKVIIVDHLHILSDKKRIDDFLSICNDFKLEFPNFTLVGYFQLNRTLETMWRGNADSKPNPKNFRPHSGFIYNTDSLQQFADLIYTLIIPQVANMDEYASVSKDYYDHLKDHFVENSGDSTWARLKGRNRLYVDVIKVRLVDDFEDPRLFCFLLDPTKEDKEVKPFEPKTKTDTSAMPNFDEIKEKPIEPGTLEDVFGPAGDKEDERDDMPF